MCVSGGGRARDLDDIRPDRPRQRRAVDGALVRVRLGRRPATGRNAGPGGGGAEVEAVGDVAAQGVVDHEGRLAPLLELGALQGGGEGVFLLAEAGRCLV